MIPSPIPSPYKPTQFFLTETVPGLCGPLQMSAWIFSPPGPAKGILFCLPGGSYSKAYYHLAVPGMPEDAYSFALSQVQHGWIVIAIDYLGSGASTHSAEDHLLSMERIVCANDMVVRQISYRALAGTLAEDIPMFSRPPVIIGIGHSLGGMLAIAQQAYHDSFDAIAVLGWSNIHLSFGEATEAQLVAATGGTTEDKGSQELARQAGLSLSLHAARIPFRLLFYAPDVPKEVILADEALATVMPKGLLLDREAPERASELAVEIDVPVFCAFGTAIDVSKDVQAERQTYSPLAEVATFEVPGSAHCHNFASQRHLLWNRMSQWEQHVAGG